MYVFDAICSAGIAVRQVRDHLRGGSNMVVLE